MAVIQILSKHVRDKICKTQIVKLEKYIVQYGKKKFRQTKNVWHNNLYPTTLRCNLSFSKNAKKSYKINLLKKLITFQISGLKHKSFDYKRALQATDVCYLLCLCII